MPRWIPVSDEQARAQWIARIRAKCIVTERGCWYWPGHVTLKGYGQTTYPRRGNVMIHRQMYKSWHQVELTFEQQVCHSCDVTRCCNPDHLWLGTNVDNHKDKDAKGRNYFSNLTHCKRGREFTPDNTRVRTYGRKTMRTCLACEKERQQSPEYKAKALERQRRAREAKRSQVSV